MDPIINDSEFDPAWLEKYVMPNYGRFPIWPERGEGRKVSQHRFRNTGASQKSGLDDSGAPLQCRPVERRRRVVPRRDEPDGFA